LPDLRFSTVVVMKSTIFWDIMLCSPLFYLVGWDRVHLVLWSLLAYCTSSGW
jgi:hypothetical protein